jgi:hypothetical protein
MCSKADIGVSSPMRPKPPPFVQDIIAARIRISNLIWALRLGLQTTGRRLGPAAQYGWKTTRVIRASHIAWPELRTGHGHDIASVWLSKAWDSARVRRWGRNVSLRRRGSARLSCGRFGAGRKNQENCHGRKTEHRGAMTIWRSRGRPDPMGFASLATNQHQGDTSGQCAPD